MSEKSTIGYVILLERISTIEDDYALTAIIDAARKRRAELVLAAAKEDPVGYMQRTGWHRCSAVLDEAQALAALQDQLGDPDYVTAATRTCAGFIIWHWLK